MAGRRRRREEDKSDKGDLYDYSDDLDSKEMPVDDATIERRIEQAKHPLEKLHFISNKHLSPTQKAIICCIQLNGGEANESEILSFLLRHWNFIKTINPKLPNNLPDTRVLHINLVVKKKGVHLFLQSKEDSLTWYLNTSDEVVSCSTHQIRSNHETRSNYETRSSRREAIQQSEEHEEKQSESSEESVEEDITTPFEDLVLEIVKQKPKGINFKEIVDKAKNFEGRQGLFMTLPHKYRVRACLVTFRANGTLFEKLGKWSLVPPSMPKTQFTEISSIPSAPEKAKGVKVNKMNLHQLWETLKAKKIYL